MGKRGIEHLIGALCLCLLPGLTACKQDAPADGQAPVLDMVALADFELEDAGFSQVLLKLQLLHTRSDILKYGIHTPEEHQERLQYYRAQFKEDVYLVSGADTLPCYDLHAERLYMDLPYMNFILTFNHPVSRGDKLLVNDIVYTQQTVLLDIDPKTQAE